jgi:hypothetical protein
MKMLNYRINSFGMEQKICDVASLALPSWTMEGDEESLKKLLGRFSSGI